MASGYKPDSGTVSLSGNEVSIASCATAYGVTNLCDLQDGGAGIGMVHFVSR